MRIPIHVEVWIASRLLSEEKKIFSKKQLNEVIRRIFNDTRSGISTHISSCCVAVNGREKLSHLWSRKVSHFSFKIDSSLSSLSYSPKIGQCNKM